MGLLKEVELHWGNQIIRVFISSDVENNKSPFVDFLLLFSYSFSRSFVFVSLRRLQLCFKCTSEPKILLYANICMNDDFYTHKIMIHVLPFCLDYFLCNNFLRKHEMSDIFDAILNFE